jgi:hypothetical protein
VTQRTNVHKLKKIKSIITEFNATLIQRPYRNKIDQARTTAILSEILNVLWKEIEERHPPRQELFVPPALPDIDLDTQKELNMQELQKIRKKGAAE